MLTVGPVIVLGSTFAAQDTVERPRINTIASNTSFFIKVPPCDMGQHEIPPATRCK
jgi:hypothetical protein